MLQPFPGLSAAADQSAGIDSYSYTFNFTDEVKLNHRQRGEGLNIDLLLVEF